MLSQWATANQNDCLPHYEVLLHTPHVKSCFADASDTIEWSLERDWPGLNLGSIISYDTSGKSIALSNFSFLNCKVSIKIQLTELFKGLEIKYINANPYRYIIQK